MNIWNLWSDRLIRIGHVNFFQILWLATNEPNVVQLFVSLCFISLKKFNTVGTVNLVFAYVEMY